MGYSRIAVADRLPKCTNTNNEYIHICHTFDTVKKNRISCKCALCAVAGVSVSAQILLSTTQVLSPSSVADHHADPLTSGVADHHTGPLTLRCC